MPFVPSGNDERKSTVSKGNFRREGAGKLPVDLSSIDFYTTCMEVGLLLGRKAAEIKDAYWAAADEARARV